jgi:competence protein ComGC
MKEAPRSIGKKGQVTIFVILAIVIVVLGVLIYLFFPGIKTTATSVEENPVAYFQSCVQGNLSANVETVSLQGGSMNPSSSVVYMGNKIAYLCYTNQPYTESPTIMCVPQVAFLVSSIESQLKQSMAATVHNCFSQMKQDYTSKGYTDVNLQEGDFNVNLLPNKVVLHSNTQLTLTKGSQKYYDSFDVVLNNNLFELASLASTIVGWEETYGNADPVYFMNYYPDLNITKNVLSDWTKVWIIQERSTGDKFEFAVRSINWPLGIPKPSNQTAQ